MPKVYDLKWQRFRAAYLARPENQICRHCQRSVWTCRDHAGRLLPAHVDHIKRLEDGGAKYDDANVQPLCHACHARKSALEMQGKAPTIKGCTPDGVPLDPDHPWSAH
jgi:5-methylcytosine-specific restriction protein A